MTIAEDPRQLQLELAHGCKSCGGPDHDDCGYDQETVRPAMTIARALSDVGPGRAIDLGGLS